MVVCWFSTHTLVLASTRLLGVLTTDVPPGALAVKQKKMRTRKLSTIDKDTYLHVWSSLSGSGRPQAIFRSLQNKQASACFFSAGFLADVSLRTD